MAKEIEIPQVKKDMVAIIFAINTIDNTDALESIEFAAKQRKEKLIAEYTSDEVDGGRFCKHCENYFNKVDEKDTCPHCGNTN